MHFLTFSKNCVPHVNGVFMFLGCYCNNNSQFLFPLFKWMQNRRKISKLEITTQIWHSCHYYIIATTELGIIYIILHSKQYTKQVYIRQHTCIHSDVTLCLFSRILMQYEYVCRLDRNIHTTEYQLEVWVVSTY